MEKTVAVVIVAAGRGERAGSHPDGPKQFREIGGRTVLEHSLAPFLSHPATDRIVVVVHPDDRQRVETILAPLQSGPVAITITTGGSDRQASVLNGLEALADGRKPVSVLIHDAARPFVDAELLSRVLEGLEQDAGALPVVPVADTLKRGDAGRVAGTVDRSGLFAAQTPQGFSFGAILEAHRRAAQSAATGFTDDASIAEWAGLPVRLVEGEPANVKLTTGRDIALADKQLRRAPMIDVRTGNGYDVHKLVEGDHVTLCGVRIAHDQSLSGHSDADVGFHALTDALLATCGAGDIGDHFPPSDPQWRGAPSRIFLERARAIVEDHGGRIMNADVSLVCEAPKIAPHRMAMREAIAACLKLDVTRVSVKATTNETIGFVGRREGIAAIATASVSYGETA